MTQSSNPLGGVYKQDWEALLAPGVVLIADPFLADGFFERTVVLLLHAEASEGAMGLVLNRPTSPGVMPDREAINEYLAWQAGLASGLDGRHLDQELSLPPCRSGGPVDVQDWFMLRLRQEGDTNGMPEISFSEVGEEASLDRLLPDMPEPGSPEWYLQAEDEKVLFFAGYAGWTAGQLESELDAKSWILYNGGFEWFSYVHHPDLWAILLKSMGGSYSMMATYPRHPVLN
jgi:putative transcriptional regulator